MDEDNCGNCFFFFKPSDKTVGICRRYPPKVLIFEGEFFASYPNVWSVDWCGEWRHYLDEAKK